MARSMGQTGSQREGITRLGSDKLPRASRPQLTIPTVFFLPLGHCSTLRRSRLSQPHLHSCRGLYAPPVCHRFVVNCSHLYEFRTINRGVTFQVNNGRSVLFWEDVWACSLPLRLHFPKIYAMRRNKRSRVCENWESDHWHIDLRRNIWRGENGEWDELNLLLQGVCLNNQEDQIRWAFEKSGKYSCRSLYRNLTFRGVRSIRLQKF